jgi:hypothetical protein
LILAGLALIYGHVVTAWVDSHDKLVTALATTVAAIATGVLAFVTFVLVRATYGLVQEAQSDRYLDWSPYVVADITDDTAHFHNIGRGPAIGCFYSPPLDLQHHWRRTRTVNLAPNEATDAEIKLRSTGTPPPSSAHTVGSEPKAVDVWFCSDPLGRVYRFSRCRTFPEVQHTGGDEVGSAHLLDQWAVWALIVAREATDD